MWLNGQMDNIHWRDKVRGVVHSTRTSSFSSGGGLSHPRSRAMAEANVQRAYMQAEQGEEVVICPCNDGEPMQVGLHTAWHKKDVAGDHIMKPKIGKASARVHGAQGLAGAQ